MSNVAVSVVMPVYNVAPHLKQCLDTLLAQTLKNIEIIAIEDGSSDESYAILNEYAADDPRMTVLKNPYNIGAARTRNIGIQLARGKYVAILDSDDFFELNFLETMYQKAESTDSELVICDIYMFNNESGRDTGIFMPEFLLRRIRFPFRPAEMAKYIFSTFWVAPFNKLVRRSLLIDTQIAFQDLSNCNDVFFGSAVLVVSKKIAFVDRRLIHYRSAWGGNIAGRRQREPLCTYAAMKKLSLLLCGSDLFGVYSVSFHTLVLIIIYLTWNLLGEEERRRFLKFWQQEGLPSLGMSDLSENDFMTRHYFLQWKTLIGEGTISGSFNRKLFRDFYESFFREMLLRNLHVAIWGYGKEGKEFSRMAKTCDFSLIEAYDKDESKWQDGEIAVKAFAHRDSSVNAVVVTNIAFTREVVAEVWKQSLEIRIFDFASYLWHGASFVECEVRRDG